MFILFLFFISNLVILSEQSELCRCCFSIFISDNAFNQFDAAVEVERFFNHAFDRISVISCYRRSRKFNFIRDKTNFTAIFTPKYRK